MQTACTARALSRVQSFNEQRAETVFGSILLQPDHFATDQVRQDGPEVLPLPALDFIDAQVPGPMFGPRPIPRVEKRAFRPVRRPPAHDVAHGRVTGRH